MTRPVTGQSFSHDTTGPVSQFAMTRQGSHSLSGEMTGLQSNSYDAARQTVTHLNMTRPGSHSFHDDVASQSVTHVAMSRQGLDQSFNYDTTNQPVTQVNMTRQGDSQSFGNDGARLPVGYENISRPASRSFVNDATSQPIAYANMARPGTSSVLSDRIDTNYHSITGQQQSGCTNNQSIGYGPTSIIHPSGSGYGNSRAERSFQSPRELCTSLR